MKKDYSETHQWITSIVSTTPFCKKCGCLQNTKRAQQACEGLKDEQKVFDAFIGWSHAQAYDEDGEVKSFEAAKWHKKVDKLLPYIWKFLRREI